MSSGAADNPVTRLLEQTRDDRAPAAALFPLVYDELRRLAARHMAGERPDHTLSATALVHEAYLRLVGTVEIDHASKAHFFAATAQAMRRILIEHARSKGRAKRGGGGARRLPLDVIDLAQACDPDTVLAVDEAVTRLEAEAPDVAAVVKLRFFAGLGVEETARMLGVSERSINRDWAYARAWLYRALGGEQP